VAAYFTQEGLLKQLSGTLTEEQQRVKRQQGAKVSVLPTRNGTEG
jgi:uncharacterized coiled-coil protein SlyX